MKRNLPALASLAAVALGVAAFACSSAPAIPDDLEGAQTPPESTAPTGTSTVQEADASVPDTGAACKAVPPNDKCGLDPQCGCGSNETCDVTNDTNGATSCVTAGAATVGRPCFQTGDCIAGLACVFGACRPYCGTALSKCTVAGTSLCVAVLDGADKPITNKNVCTINCDPMNPAGVCGTNACHWFDTYYAPEKVTDCNYGGTTPALGTCVDTSDCQPGYACIDHPSSKIGFECEKWCRVGQDSDCDQASGFRCKDVFGANAPVINGVKEGVCQD
ncbi:MAG: hypothetical protein JWP97_1310 [Labilithrix sp.]|nr:hypothetical protein [Labilithrix sp.]